MGNCLDIHKPVTWVEDEEDDYWEWESMEIGTSHQQQQQKKITKKKESSSTAAGEATEIKIKIKISKKQLEELLRQVDSDRVPLRRALFDLASGGAESPWEEQQQHQLFHHHEHWKPELQSIPEVPECDNRNS